MGGPFGSSLVSDDYTPTGVPVIRGANLGHGRFLSGDYAYVSPAKARELARNQASPGDLVFTQRGTLGQVAVVPERGPESYVVSQSQMRLTVDPHRADALYIYYACNSAMFLRQITDHAISTGVPHINLGILGSLTVPNPPLPEQRAIAEVLGALDDKIAANTRLATTADGLVRARWGRLVDLHEASRDLRAVGDVVRSQVDPGALDPELPYVGLEHIPRRSLWLAERGVAAGVSSAKSRFAAGDVLFGKLRPYFHKVVCAPVEGICSTDVLVLRANTPDMAGYLLAAAASDEVVAQATASSEGTRMPRTSWRDLGTVAIPWPGEQQARSFSSEVTAIRLTVESRLRENHRLAATRDALLPALMSGTLRVRDAEQLASDLT